MSTFDPAKAGKGFSPGDKVVTTIRNQFISCHVLRFGFLKFRTKVLYNENSKKGKIHRTIWVWARDCHRDLDQQPTNTTINQPDISL